MEDPFQKSVTCCCLPCVPDTRQRQDRDETLGQYEREEKVEERERERDKDIMQDREKREEQYGDRKEKRDKKRRDERWRDVEYVGVGVRVYV